MGWSAVCDCGISRSYFLDFKYGLQRVGGGGGQGCKIPLACSHLRVKCYAGRVKVLTICVVLSNLQHLREKLGT